MRQRRLCEAPHSLLPSIASADSQLTESAEEQITTLCVCVCKCECVPVARVSVLFMCVCVGGVRLEFNKQHSWQLEEKYQQNS